MDKKQINPKSKDAEISPPALYVIICKLHDSVSLIFYKLGALTVFFLVASMCYEVLMRYIFNAPTNWAVDFSEYALIYATFLAIPWLYKTGGHTAISTVVDRLPLKVKPAAFVFAKSACFLACLFVAYYSLYDTYILYQDYDLLIRPIIVPKYLIVMIIPLGILLMGIYPVRDLLDSAFSINSKSIEAGE